MLDPYSIAAMLEKRGPYFVFDRIELPAHTKINILREYELPFRFGISGWEICWKYSEGRYWKLLRYKTSE